MPKLSPFNVAEWSKGVHFTIPADSTWGIHEAQIKIGRAKKPKPVKSIKPTNRMVANADDSGRSLKAHRKAVELYGKRYDSGLDPLTSKPIDSIPSTEYFTEDGLTGELRERETPRQVNEMAGCSTTRINKPWTVGRGGAHAESEGLSILMTALAGRGVEDED